MSYLDSLNEVQRQAVEQTEGPVMIIAGAGSGKTRVLTYRIAHLIKKGVEPFNILSLTFTNKAAKEMQHRIQTVCGSEARNVMMGTFHSVFSKILRVESSRLGFPSNFTIYDTEDSKGLLRTILKEQNLDDKVYKPNTVFNRISAAKNRLISYTEYIANPNFTADDRAALRPEMGKLYKTYQERLIRAGAMDFDDLLFYTFKLFNEHPDVLNKYQHRFKYIMVDEFQDTNIAQYSITKKLAAMNRNICVVGDDAQSIYAFRGADIQNILNFEKDYSELKVLKLEQNYRSTKTIVEAANNVITKNKAQLKKDVWTSNESGEKIHLYRAASDNEEGRIVAQAIFESKMNLQLRNNDFAILYRTNSQSRSFEEALRKLNINYKVVGGMSFYQRKEIKDVLAYLRFVLNDQDEQSFRRIVNFPKRGIGDTTIAKIFVIADEQGASVWDVLCNAKSVMTGRLTTVFEGFVDMIKSYKILAQTKDAFEAANEIAKQSGLLKELYEDKTVEGIARYENVQELLNGIKEFVDRPDQEDKSLGTYLQEISLLTDTEDKNEKDSVTLMTIHSAKGLEFNQVFVVGIEEDLFPSAMMLNSRADLEEERRLFYVAITRAEKRLSLSFATSRYRFGQLKSCSPSRFLEEIDPRHLQMTSITANSINSQEQSPAFVGIKPKTTTATVIQTKAKAAPAYTPSADFKPSDTSNLAVGMKVEHPKFGFGEVKNIQSNGNDRKALIDFKNLGEKTLILSFAKLRIHES
ncbi:ATP-dependent helicase [Cytophaga aurantiaca]|uniref:ATP-dependent helicase n=1 Tax=Cytophaga aurantiaca TaxID=29530 RepID=UPI00037D1966|nr:UvrD-helicase domain-containing protein [Cytophaga aurantiaca]